MYRADLIDLGSALFIIARTNKGRGKSGSGRTIICYSQEDRAIFIHGFSKNEKSKLAPTELKAFKELARVLLSLSLEEIEIAVHNGDLIQLK